MCWTSLLRAQHKKPTVIWQYITKIIIANLTMCAVQHLHAHVKENLGTFQGLQQERKQNDRCVWPPLPQSSHTTVLCVKGVKPDHFKGWCLQICNLNVIRTSIRWTWHGNCAVPRLRSSKATIDQVGMPSSRGERQQCQPHVLDMAPSFLLVQQILA